MSGHIYWFLMFIQPAPAQPQYIEQMTDPVACQIRVIQLRESHPTHKFECKSIKSMVPMQSFSNMGQMPAPVKPMPEKPSRQAANAPQAMTVTQRQ
jgi:hypothetical protein